MFTIRPTQQGQGYGKQLLAAAEAWALREWHIERWEMCVITLRHELIAFYLRRGYRRTGLHQPFPLNPTLWTPKVDGLEFEVLEKTADVSSDK